VARRWDALRGTIRPEAALTIGLAVVLVGTLWWRDELPVPATPEPPPVSIDVDGASIGPEQNDAGRFWTIDAEAMTVTVTNTTTTTQDVTVSFRVRDAPCGRRGQVTVTEATTGGRWQSSIPTDGLLDVRLDPIEIPPLSSVEVRTESDVAPCPPVGGDPRSILFQVFDLQAAPV
jgi:hypothetical protein